MHAAAVERAIAIFEAHQAVLPERPVAFVLASGFRHAEDLSVGPVVLDILVAAFSLAAQRVADDHGFHFVERHHLHVVREREAE
jgi:hypothetical protein